MPVPIDGAPDGIEPMQPAGTEGNTPPVVTVGQTVTRRAAVDSVIMASIVMAYILMAEGRRRLGSYGLYS